MFCKQCDNNIYLSAITTGKCKECGKLVPTPHLPSFKVCKDCSEKLSLCQQCGQIVISKE